MSIGLLSLLLIVGIIFLLLLGLPLAFTTGSVATLATLLLFGPDALYLIVARVFDMMGNYVLVAVPLFAFRAGWLSGQLSPAV
jgi:TRAP-type mannitol/chloroaromatic compound transport system permease large subunit